MRREPTTGAGQRGDRTCPRSRNPCGMLASLSGSVGTMHASTALQQVTNALRPKSRPAAIPGAPGSRLHRPCAGSGVRRSVRGRQSVRVSRCGIAPSRVALTRRLAGCAGRGSPPFVVRRFQVTPRRKQPRGMTRCTHALLICSTRSRGLLHWIRVHLDGEYAGNRKHQCHCKRAA